MGSLDDIKRFWSKVEFKEGCWPWRGAIFSKTKGRGQFKVNKKTVKAHRYAYALIKGPIPDGLTIDHLCRNPNCVNPWHLEAVTQKVNASRVIRQTHCKRGHERVAGTRRCKICAISFRPSRLPEKRRLQYLANKERKNAQRTACS